jgi:drug/metabolite transporter (DMT)-like permease
MVLGAAGIHAWWNLIAKRVAGGAAFAWLVTALSATLYAPAGIAVWIAVRPELGAEAWLFIAGTAFLHAVYLLFLLRGYRTGDLSVVYPVARGTGPTLAAIAAIAVLGERPTPLAIAGIVLVAAGVLALAGGPSLRARLSAGSVAWGIATGIVIAVYTLWDKHAVDALAINVIVYDWAANVGRVGVLLPPALRVRGAIGAAWRDHRREAIAVAALSPLAYILVLTALSTSPVSYVAPVREVSILIGALLGARLLHERDMARRAPAAAAIVAGVIALSVG